jgi:hypothetical protein
LGATFKIRAPHLKLKITRSETKIRFYVHRETRIINLDIYSMENRALDELSFASSRKRANCSNTLEKTPTRQSICQLNEDKRVQRYKFLVNIKVKQYFLGCLSRLKTETRQCERKSVQSRTTRL